MKVKLDENLPLRLKGLLQQRGHDVDTVLDEGLQGRPDSDVWAAAQAEGRFLITQDLDFSDSRRFEPGSHAGLLLVRLRSPGAQALLDHMAAALTEHVLDDWSRCFVVLTDHKLRIKRP